jgi:hypothetical protein
MREGSIVMTWIAIAAVIAVVLGCLVFFSDGPVPYFVQRCFARAGLVSGLASDADKLAE